MKMKKGRTRMMRGAVALNVDLAAAVVVVAVVVVVVAAAAGAVAATSRR